MGERQAEQAIAADAHDLEELKQVTSVILDKKRGEK